MKKTYYQEIQDKHIYKLANADDQRAYYVMRMLQQRREPKVITPFQPTKDDLVQIVADAYVQTFCHRKKITSKEPIVLDSATKQQLYKFYLAGVLPVRLGGITLKR